MRKSEFSLDPVSDLGLRSPKTLFLKNSALLLIVSRRPGGIAELTRIISNVGVSIKDIVHERAWVRKATFSVGVSTIGMKKLGGDTGKCRHLIISIEPEVKVTKIILTRKKSNSFFPMGNHKRGSFSDLRFPSTIELAYRFLSTAKRGLDGVHLPFYLCL